jgi:uncharacterized protein DUF222
MYVRTMTTAASTDDRGRRRDAALLDRMVEVDTQLARLECELAGAIAEFLDLRRAEPVDAVAADKGKVLAGEFADEIAAALGWSTTRVHSRARLYRRLASGLPRTAALWRSGAIDGYKAGKVAEAADRLTRPESVNDLDDKVAERITDQTPTQLQQWLNRRVARVEPDAAERRHRRAHADRKVCTEQGLDGMGSLWMAAGAADISAIDTHLTGLARGLGREDPRTMDQRRADLAVDLLSGRFGPSPDSKQSATGSAVGVVVPLQSLLGVDDAPGELADRSASVPAPLARQIAARPGTLFYRLLTDARGNLLDVTQLGRFPSELLGFAVDVRDGTCRWPTCTTAAAKCDRDHTVSAPDGPTAAGNLGNDCRRHHRAKTHAGYHVDQPEPGTFVWRTPTGHRYTVEPEPLPVGSWPRPAIHDHDTPLAELIDLVDLDEPHPILDRSTVLDALGPRAGPEPLLAWECDLIAESARAP